MSKWKALISANQRTRMASSLKWQRTSSEVHWSATYRQIWGWFPHKKHQTRWGECVMVQKWSKKKLFMDEHGNFTTNKWICPGTVRFPGSIVANFTHHSSSSILITSKCRRLHSGGPSERLKLCTRQPTRRQFCKNSSSGSWRATPGIHLGNLGSIGPWKCRWIFLGKHMDDCFFYVMMMRNRSCRDGFREIAVKWHIAGCF